MSHSKDVLFDPYHNMDGQCLICKAERTKKCEECGQPFPPSQLQAGKYHIGLLILCEECYEKQARYLGPPEE